MKHYKVLCMNDPPKLINNTDHSHMDRAISDHHKAMEELTREQQRRSIHDQQINSSRSLVMAALLLVLALGAYLLTYSLL